MVVFPSRNIIVPKKVKRLSDYTEGDIVYIPEGALMVAFYVAKHNYESDLNGTGRTLLVRKDPYIEHIEFNKNHSSKYADSILDTFLNGEYKTFFDENIQQAMGATTFYYTTKGGKYGTVTTLERAIFTLSVTELGFANVNANIEGTPLSIASSLQIAYDQGEAVPQWTRSPNNKEIDYTWRVSKSGVLKTSIVQGSCHYRPVFTLPDTTKFYYDTDVFKEVS